MTRNRLPLRPVVLVLLACCAALPGCSGYIDPFVPEPIRPCKEPEFGSEYLLYRPSHYDRRQSWPLVVACSGGFPDTPNLQIRSWTQFAESYGFLVAVPTLVSNKSYWKPPEPFEHVELLREDERRILAMIRQIRAGHSISEDRMFIHGWSRGTHAALKVGMKYPDLFRAVAISHPRFEETVIGNAANNDLHQPVFLLYQLTDTVTGKNAKRCAEWLEARFVDVMIDPRANSAMIDAERVIVFFENVVRSRPWIRIRAYAGRADNPLAVKFKLSSSIPLAQYHWTFSDGGTSHETNPLHVFQETGTYRVDVEVHELAGHSYQRSINLKVPEGVIAADRPVITSD